jgi:hypothetical protein
MGHLFTLVVDGETFAVAEDAEHPGSVQYSWLSGPNPGYGFATGVSGGGMSGGGMSGGGLPDRAAAESQIWLFLAAVDPTTGYLD